MNVLGISAFAHESSACLLTDGRLVALVEEERFNRERHTSRFPVHSIRTVLELGGVTPDQVDEVTFFWDPWLELRGNMAYFLSHLPWSIGLLMSPSGSPDHTLLGRLGRKITVRGALRKNGIRSRSFSFVEHHLAHAASCFFVSPFEEAAILTVDGRGERTTTLIASGSGSRITKLREIHVPNSLGHLYAAVTDFLGFRPFHDEWKVMALAAYGEKTFCGDFDRMVRSDSPGGFELDMEYFSFQWRGRGQWVSPVFVERFGAPRRPGEELTQRHYDVAYALQRTVERIGVRLAIRAHELTGSDNLCLAGGTVMNCLMNKCIVEQAPYRNVFIQPVANDAGTSMGSALYHYHQTRNRPRVEVFENIYLGPEYTENRMRVALEDKGLRFERSSDVVRDAARRIAEGQIIGWFQGRMEAGPRALGNRSILADPRRAESKTRINEMIKKREWFRPFAPAVLEEDASDYFDMRMASPYMILAADVKPLKRPVIPAVVHRDGTARVQTVSRRQNPLFRDLLAEFKRLTGVPVLLNTSFNENEPIVCSPEEAVGCFQRTTIDSLVMGPFVAGRDGR
ncbi:MAG TPA: carbamoyltransferase C-terminal domain-containing protein [Elusimicrobiota bacterium]|nr:carbamoyltransferase C-terminal domain-containing protein [Elusimicrobiota bacterium]